MAVVLVCMPLWAHADTRDWTVENPILSGYLRGLSLYTVSDLAIGESTVEASEYDPFGMTEAVRAELIRIGRLNHLVASWIGVFSTFFLIGGCVFRKRHTLKLMEMKNA